MTKDQQYDFVRTLIANVEGDLLQKLDRIPEDWDGHELRIWLAERFEDSASLSLIRKNKRSARARDYRNTKLVNGL